MMLGRGRRQGRDLGGAGGPQCTRAECRAPEPGTARRPKPIVVLHQFVVAVAEKGEMIGHHPFAGTRGLPGLPGPRLAGFHAVDRDAREFDDLRPVFDRRAHVAATRLAISSRSASSFAASPQRSTSKWMNESAAKRVSVACFGALRSAASIAPSRARQTRNTGCTTECSARPVPVDLHRHRIDQERHVVVDDLDHGVIGVPAVLFENRVIDAQPFGARARSAAPFASAPCAAPYRSAI